MEDYEKITDLFEREVYKDAYKRLRSFFEKKEYHLCFPFNSIEEARIILRHASKFKNNRFIDDAMEYLYKQQYDFQRINKYESEKYWNNVSTVALLIIEEEEYARVRQENKDNEDIPVYSDNLGDADILEVTVSYVAYDDYPGQYRHIDIGRIHKKDLDKIKDYVINEYVSYNLSHGGYNYSISVVPYVEPKLLKFA